jgi:hypothetical protein
MAQDRKISSVGYSSRFNTQQPVDVWVLARGQGPKETYPNFIIDPERPFKPIRMKARPCPVPEVAIVWEPDLPQYEYEISIYHLHDREEEAWDKLFYVSQAEIGRVGDQIISLTQRRQGLTALMTDARAARLAVLSKEQS